MNFPTITMEELEIYVDQGNEFEIIDLRNHASFEKCHFMSAVNIPYQELNSKAADLPKGKHLVLYCSRGGQSLLACIALEQMGYPVINVANGIAFYQGKYMVRT